jgi:hypothetical protein
MVGGIAAGLIDHGTLPEPTAPRADNRLVLDARLMRLYQYGLMTFPAIMTGNVERALEMIDLALAVCRDPEPGEAGPVLERVAPALETAKKLIPDPERARLATGLIFMSFNLAATSVA